MTRAEEQIMLREYFGPADRDTAHAVCQVMAEIYMMRPGAVVKIAGEDREAGMVAEVFAEVQPEHVASLVAKIRQGALDQVRNRRAYIRSMLYNEVFEADIDASAAIREVWG